jgi:hypothetical protein
LIEEDPQCGSFFLVLRLTNNSKQICCTALIRIQKEFFPTPFLISPTLLGLHNIAMRLRSGAEERGCGYRVKEARIYVQMQMQSTSSSRQVLRSRP